MASEDAAGAFTLQIIFYLFLLFLLGFTIFGIQNVQTIDFKNYVDGQLESHGGLTRQAQTNINEYSNSHYQGRYSVTSSSGANKLPFGEPIHYEIRGSIKIFFMDVGDQITLKKGKTVSYVR